MLGQAFQTLGRAFQTLCQAFEALKENQKLGRGFEKLSRVFKNLDRVFVSQHGPCCPNQPRYGSIFKFNHNTIETISKKIKDLGGSKTSLVF